MRIATCFALAAGLVWAQGGERELTIRTIDLHGHTVANVSVIARHGATGSETGCTTDQSGICKAVLRLAGAYRLSAQSDGLEAGHSTSIHEPASSLDLVLRPGLLRASVTVVSGSRVEELQDESPSKVDAVTQKQIESTGYERVSDVLQEIPGVLVRRGNTSTVGGEQIQGIDSRQVLVLQDGLPVLGARGIKFGAVNLNRQSSGRLSRVEVAKGTSSSLYGSDAIGGVINMITKEPQNPLEGGFVVSGGSLGTFDGRGDMGARRGRGSYFLNLGANRMDSYTLIPNSAATVGPQIRRDDILFKTRYQIVPKLALAFTANAYRNREDGRNISETGPVAGLSNDSTQSYALAADWVIDSSTTMQARGYRARYDENNLTRPIGRAGVPSPSNLNERLGRLDATISRQIGSKHFLQGGAEWAQNLYRGANRLVGDNAGQQVTSRDYWLQDKWTIHPRLTMTAGGRVTNHSLFGNASVPKAGLIFRVNDSVILRASFGMGFRAPDLGQLYFRFANPASFYQVIGNPGLKPEHSQSWQLGATVRRRQYRAGLTLFHNNIRDLIDTRLIGTPRTSAELKALIASYGIPVFFDPLLGRQTYVYLNQAKIFTRGVELDGEYAFNRQLRIYGAYTFLNARDRVTQLALAQRHRHTGVVRADYGVPKLGINANVRGAFYSHWLLNAAAGTRGLPYQIWDAYVSKSWPRGLETFVAADNFNNSRDGKLRSPVPSIDRPDYGRTYRAGLRYRLGGKE